MSGHRYVVPGHLPSAPNAEPSDATSLVVPTPSAGVLSHKASSGAFQLRSYRSMVGQGSSRWPDDHDDGAGAGELADLPEGDEGDELGGVHETKTNPVAPAVVAGPTSPKPAGALARKPHVSMSALRSNAVGRRWSMARGTIQRAVALQKTYVGAGPWEPPESESESSGEEEFEHAEDVLKALHAAEHLRRASQENGDAVERAVDERGRRAALPQLPQLRSLRTLHHHSKCYRALQRYHHWGRRVMNRRVVQANWFKSFIMGIIGVAAVTVGMQTYELDDNVQWVVSSVAEPIVQWVFVAEVIIMLTSFGKRPWLYFKDGWNVFDFFIVVVSFLPIGGSSVTTLRLLRLLRLLKLVKALPKLRMLVLGLLNSLSSIGYISLLLGLQFYLYAVLGVIMFGGGDPYYFGTLDRALVSLWQSATGDDWSDQLYTGIFGCNAAEASDPAYAGQKSILCTNAESFGFVMPTLYFVSFQLLAGLMLLNLFVGAILMAVQDAKDEVDQGDVLTVQVLKAEDLVAADGAMMGGLSDPFVVVQYGHVKHKTKVKKNTLNPIWANSSFDFIMHNVEEDGDLDPGDEPQVISFYVYDWDRFGAPDPLGSFHLKIDTIPFEREFTFRMELADVPTGWLTVKVWKSTLGPPADGDEEKVGRIRKLQFVVDDALAVLQEMMDVAGSVAKKHAARRSLMVKLGSLRRQMSKKLVSSFASLRSRGSGRGSRGSGTPQPTAAARLQTDAAGKAPIMVSVASKGSIHSTDTPLARARRGHNRTVSGRSIHSNGSPNDSPMNYSPAAVAASPSPARAPATSPAATTPAATTAAGGPGVSERSTGSCRTGSASSRRRSPAGLRARSGSHPVLPPLGAAESKRLSTVASHMSMDLDHLHDELYAADALGRSSRRATRSSRHPSLDDVTALQTAVEELLGEPTSPVQ